MRKPMMSGHCAFPQTAHPERSHQRCHDMGAGNTASQSGEFAPCPCSCHVIPEPLECTNCGGDLYEAPMLGPDEDGDMQYVHLTEDGLRIDLSGCP
jgi:hypothetical protein